MIACPTEKVTVLFVTAVVIPVPPAKVSVSLNKLTASVPVPPAIFKLVATEIVEAAVIKPFALTVITGIAIAEPKLPTSALTVAKVIAVLTFAEPSTLAKVAVASPVSDKLRAFNHFVVVAELPIKSAVMLRAVKSPFESRFTSVPTVFKLVAASTISV